MKNTWAVCKREFASFFLTPIGYVVTGMFALLSGLGFTLSLFFYAKVSQDPSAFAYPAVPDFEETLLSPFLVYAGMLIMFLTPLITMRLLAEERHRGTIELLLTFPLRDREIIFGKYCAALGMLLVMMLIISVDLLIVSHFVDIEPPVLVCGVAAVFLMGAAFISLGLFISAITRNQITSGTITFGLTLIMYIFGSVGDDIPEAFPAPESWPAFLTAPAAFLYGVLRKLLIELPADVHAKDLALGIVHPKDPAYFVVFSAFFLFLTFRALESRNWRR